MEWLPAFGNTPFTMFALLTGHNLRSRMSLNHIVYRSLPDRES